MPVFKYLFVFLAALSLAGPAWAQESKPSPMNDMLPPVLPPAAQAEFYSVERLELDIKIDGQLVRAVLRQTVRNTGASLLEMDYLVPLPTESEISGLILLADGQELAGKIYDRKEAFAVYQQIVQQIKDPALMEYVGRGLFRARIFPIPPKEARTLELSLQYMLQKKDDVLTLNFPLAGPLTKGKTVSNQEVKVSLVNVPNLANVYSPISGVEVEEGEEVKVSYSAESSPALDNFPLYIKQQEGSLGAMILSHKPDDKEDGYFLFLAEPSLAESDEAFETGKEVIFVLDTSGSMVGKKFGQAVQALKFVLERLKPEDSFNLVDFNSRVSSWAKEPRIMTPENRKQALDYLSNLRAAGGTNIERALTESLKMAGLQGKPTYLLFLTDGEPTTGKTGEKELALLAQKNNQKSVRIFSFGVGFGVQARLLDRLSGDAGGITVYVNPEDNLEDKVALLYSRLESPVLTNPKLTVDLKTNRLIPGKMPDIFQHNQTLVVGRYPAGGSVKFTLTGQAGGKSQEFTFPGVLARESDPNGEFVELLWAQRRVGEIVDYIDLNQLKDGPEFEELAGELLTLAKKYGILTPYTSFLALENISLTDNRANARAVGRNLDIIQEVTGSSATVQRGRKQDLMAAAAPMKPVPEAEAKAQFEAMADMDMAAAGSGDKMIPPKQLGSKNFFLKNGQLMDGSLTEADLKKIVEIEQFSPEYFVLAGEVAPEGSSWLSQTTPVVFKHKSKVYLIKPVAS
ncbi:MAG: VIT and VWA domain-containing protein [Deltaproteobacteria bacterium]|nr:VIT and VWA domain-containing protein [Deltaproteobacteria bacterium]